jgi:hypothetical protein
MTTQTVQAKPATQTMAVQAKPVEAAAQPAKVYDNTNTGVLAKNGMKVKDNHPDARGRCNIEGMWYWISGWAKFNGNDGSKFQSLAFTAMTQEDVDKYINKITPQATAAAVEDDLI